MKKLAKKTLINFTNWRKYQADIITEILAQ